MQRRHFLKSAVGGSAAAAMATWAPLQALAQSTSGTGYKAIVCLFMLGGNDSNNLLVPTDASYDDYQRARPNLALQRDQLLPLSLSNTAGASYGLHPAMVGLQGLVNGGKAAMLANMGPLVVPTTMAQYQARSVPLPSNLFSHSDQQGAWQSGIVDQPPRSGWGGRLLDNSLGDGDVNRGYAAISVSGGNVWEAGERGFAPYRVSPSGNFGFSFYKADGSDPLSKAVSETLAETRAHPFEQTWLNVMKRSIENQRVLTDALASSAVSTPFPDTGLGRQLKMIAKLIAVRGSLALTRQCFYCSIGGFDTHGDDQLQRQNQLFTEISEAVTAFQAAMDAMNVARDVTLMTASDFGRNLTSNGAGTDHGWGSHHMLVGGAVQGGRLIGRFPELKVGGPDDVGQGVWLPSTGTDQVGSELARWFGASDATVAAAFPRAAGFDRLVGLMA
jgi:uncharacterized protein (DUF1501 family)